MTSTHAPAAPPRSLVGLWAHPDDESYLSAGLMDRVLRTGGRVTVVTLSDGEAGFPADDTRSVEQRRCLRRAELRSAMAAIGVTDVRFVGLPDGGLADIGADVLRAAFREVLAELRPEVTVTFGPDGITGHDDHVVTSYAATEAWQELGLPDGQLWYAAKTHGWLDEWRDLHDRLGVWMTEEPTGVAEEDVALVLDLAPGELARKRAALAAHASQSGVVAEAMGEATYRRWIGQEAFRLPTPAGVGS